MTPNPQSKKIFVIGLNKCGTSSLHELFCASGITSLHWNLSNTQFLAPIMHTNIIMGLPVLKTINKAQAYSDLNFLTENVYIEASGYFENFYAEFPDALFILNTRERDRWILSRTKHAYGTFLERFRVLLSCSKEQVIKSWENHWDQHHISARDFFSGKKNFIEFDIEKDSIDKLVEFGSNNGVNFNPGGWKIANASL